MKFWKPTLRWLPALLILALLLTFYLTGFYHQFTLQNLQEKHDVAKSWVSAHPTAAPMIFLGVYTISVALVIPDSTLLCLLGGFLFPYLLALLFALLAETIGAFLFFAAMRAALFAKPHHKPLALLEKLRTGFEKNETSYMLFLRLSHIIPFWLINLAASYFRVRIWTFLWTTCIGTLPWVLIIAEGGRGLREIFAKHVPFSLAKVFNIRVQLSLLFLSLLALIPVAYRYWKSR